MLCLGSLWTVICYAENGPVLSGMKGRYIPATWDTETGGSQVEPA